MDHMDDLGKGVGAVFYASFFKYQNLNNPLECPVGIEADKKHFIALIVTYQLITVDLRISQIDIFKTSPNVQALTPLVLRADRVTKLPIDGHVGRSRISIDGAKIIRKPGHEKPGL